MVGLSYPPAVIEALKVTPVKKSYSVHGTLESTVTFVIKK